MPVKDKWEIGDLEVDKSKRFAKLRRKMKNSENLARVFIAICKYEPTYPSEVSRKAKITRNYTTQLFDILEKYGAIGFVRLREVIEGSKNHPYKNEIKRKWNKLSHQLPQSLARNTGKRMKFYYVLDEAESLIEWAGKQAGVKVKKNE